MTDEDFESQKTPPGHRDIKFYCKVYICQLRLSGVGPILYPYIDAAVNHLTTFFCIAGVRQIGAKTPQIFSIALLLFLQQR